MTGSNARCIAASVEQLCVSLGASAWLTIEDGRLLRELRKWQRTKAYFGRTSRDDNYHLQALASQIVDAMLYGNSKEDAT